MPKLFHSEKTQYKGNHQLAALEFMFRDNPNADWYLIVDDDTVIVPANLQGMIKDLNLKRHEFWYIGKCAYFEANMRKDSRTEEEVEFVVGGSGILMSHALVEALAPVVKSCRRDYNHLTYGDGRIGACIQDTLNMSSVVDPSNTCSDRLSEKRSQLGLTYKFCLGDWSKKHYKSNYTPKPDHHKLLIVSLHEKHLAHTKLFNEWFRNMTLANRTISWAALQTDKDLFEQMDNAST